MTALGAVLIVHRIRQNRHQFQRSFEDELTREYRELTKEMPVEMLLDESKPLTESELNLLYNYVDLTNEQVWLRRAGRVSRETWLNWRDGIRSNFHRENFRRGWAVIYWRTGDGTFEDLATFFHRDSADDPYDPYRDE
ncbi:hypothetical protein U3A55_06680 [Salarchaeum sp. III]|uniref:hypothetical protein n=1 Tax=Salarchaeum sp. III TaxID=3107927 RepID=UPI002ED97E50